MISNIIPIRHSRMFLAGIYKDLAIRGDLLLSFSVGDDLLLSFSVRGEPVEPCARNHPSISSGRTV